MTPSPRPIWIERAPDPLFAVLHPADPGVEARPPVLIVPPWGWHEVASYRSRRTWAAHLAATGRATLRIDLPGTGDSGGTAASPHQVDAWVDAVHAAAAWLAESTSVAAVTVIGLGLGGLVAAQAIAANAPIDELVAWAVSGDGRGEVRRQRAFARLQTARWSLSEPEPAVLPDGWLEINGFILSTETIAALEPLTVPGPSVGRLRRALVLDADGIPVARAIVGALRAGGVDVSTADGPGWSAMTFHPQHDDTPVTVIATVDRWLAESAPVARAVAAAGAVRPPALTRLDSGVADVRLRIDGIGIRETAIVRTTPAGDLFGILATPESARPTPVAALFLNAGAVRRIGPNRIWVEASRRWARNGVPSLRIDLDGIGDSDGDSNRYRDVGQFYARDDLAEQIRILTDELVASTGAERIVLAGLCAGGYWAFLGADRDPRVAAAYLLNPGALEWRTDLVRRRDARRIRRLGDPAWWGRLVRGQVRFGRIRSIAGAALREGLGRGSRHAAARSAGLADPGRPAITPTAIADRLHARDASVVIAFSGDEALREELLRDGFLDRVAGMSNVRLETLPGRDHTLRPIAAQRAVHELLDRALQADLARIGLGSDTGAA